MHSKYSECFQKACHPQNSVLVQSKLSREKDEHCAEFLTPNLWNFDIWPGLFSVRS